VAFPVVAVYPVVTVVPETETPPVRVVSLLCRVPFK
jgi:hypothetical protein